MSFRVRRIGGLSGAQIALGVFLGVVGGYYIWKPVFTTEAPKEKSTVEVSSKLFSTVQAMGKTQPHEGE
ncbi:unnamed protein product [Acanthoscelides obtectus]|uniref:Uncharacterized protein n=1 Tax=Acanthoscelides obtectus TaxID=200917 RepID=A0A9P0K8J3_ACAOB|nr:unnamed protein product [Acanthoscelides obtectus]CAK1672013.1 hypothetical protein AOBTE_LOCUS28607 [Acanthoscelides obtectus]